MKNEKRYSDNFNNFVAKYLGKKEKKKLHKDTRQVKKQNLLPNKPDISCSERCGEAAVGFLSF